MTPLSYRINVISGAMGRAVPKLKRVLFWHPFGRVMITGKTAGTAAKACHAFLAILFRVALLPIPLMLMWLGTIYALTHPTRQALTVLPEQFSLIYEDVQFTTADGVRLNGWYLSSMRASDVLEGDAWKKPRPAVIVCHSYGMARDQFLYPLGTELVAAGYDVLLFDFRGHGRSDDAPVSFGVTEAADIVAAVNYLRGRGGIDGGRIGIFGSSMGAYAAILAANRCEGVLCVVAESAYPSVHTTLRRGARQMRMPEFTGSMIGWGMSMYFGHRLTDETAVEAAQGFGQRGLLLVNGASDERMPADDMRGVLEACDTASSLVVADVKHGQAMADPSTAKLLVRYFDMYLMPMRSAGVQ